MKTWSNFTALILLFAALPHASAQQPPVRFMLYGDMSPNPPTEAFLQFIEEIQPDIVVTGVFDQRFYASAFPKGKATDPHTALEARFAGWKHAIDRLHRKNIRLVGLMELNVLTDRPQDREEQLGWFGYYAKGWDEKRLGPRPTTKVDDYLERGISGNKEQDSIATCGCRINSKAIRACLHQPAWVEVQKRMVKAAVELGVDGFMTNRNFYEHCTCAHCQAALRRHLEKNALAAQKLTCLQGTFRIIDETPDPLLLEKLRCAKERVHEFFQEVYVRYGRSLKPDLFAAQWNHAAYFDELHLDRGHLPVSTRTTLAHAIADERWGLPLTKWGKDESLLWYCNWGTTQNTILEKEYAGDTTLYAKWLRGMARGKPYVINKYDFYRPRVMMAEAAALGYATNAISTPWQHEDDRAVVTRYFSFLRKHAPLYQEVESVAEVALLFPRRALHAGDASALEYLEAAGRVLVREHFLFDMVPDDGLQFDALKKYRAVIVSAHEHLHPEELRILADYAKNGGCVLWLPVHDRDRSSFAITPTALKHVRQAQPLATATVRVDDARLHRARITTALRSRQDSVWSQCAAPWYVEMTGYHKPATKQWVVHWVNYNHQEKSAGKSVAEREAPIPTKPFAARLRLPGVKGIASLRFLDPDRDQAVDLTFTARGDELTFTVPSFNVYGVVLISEKH